MTPNEGVVPPNGFHFNETHGATTIRIEGSSYDDVAEQLLKYRLANKLELGRPKEEVLSYVCTTWPHFCKEQLFQAPTTSIKPSFTIAVLQWMQKVWQRQSIVPQMLVSDMEANRRAEICRDCPLQRDWADYGCGSCIDQVRRQSIVFRAGKEVSNASKVTGCSILEQENHSACWAHRDTLPEATQEQKDALPNRCWRKR